MCVEQWPPCYDHYAKVVHHSVHWTLAQIWKMTASLTYTVHLDNSNNHIPAGSVNPEPHQSGRERDWHLTADRHEGGADSALWRGVMIISIMCDGMKFNPRLTGGGFFLAPSRFSLISAKLMEPSTRNLQHLSGYQFYTLYANKNFVPTIGLPQITSEWRHVQAILMQLRVYKNRSPGLNF